MRLGSKTRRLLELVFMVGGEAAEALLRPRQTIAEGAGLAASRSNVRAFRLVEDEGWVRRDAARESEAEAEAWVVSLTDRAREDVMDGVDPERAWAAEWDGFWRTLSFDLPATARDARYQLDAWLKKRRFGHLQGSLWISHRPYVQWDAELSERRVDPSKMVFQESKPVGRLRDVDYVQKGWDFAEINEGYAEYLRFLENETLPGGTGDELERWQTRESQVWGEAFGKDPFLPDRLLPAGYLGKEAWSRRKSAYALLVDKLL